MIPIKVLTELETKVNRPTHILLVPTSPAHNSPFVTIMHISSPYTPTILLVSIPIISISNFSLLNHKLPLRLLHHKPYMYIFLVLTPTQTSPYEP